MAMRERSFVDVEVFRYRSGYREVNAFLAVPNAAQPMPAILLAHDIYGLDQPAEELAVRLAREGYTVLMPDLYTTKGGPPNTTSLEGQRQARRNTPDALAVGDILNGFNYLRQQSFVDGYRVAVVGYGFGGTVAILAAAQNRELAAAVNFYGDLVYPREVLGRTKPASPVEMVPYLNCPLLSIYGAGGDDVERADIALLERRLREKGKTFDLKVYPGARNGFLTQSRPDVYQAAASREALTVALNWLDRLLK